MLTVIGKAAAKLLRAFVGEEYGYDGEGNTQWYYIAGLLGTVMLIWTHKPTDIAILFTIYAILHVVTVGIAGSNLLFDEEEAKGSKKLALIYFAFHVALFIAALITNWLWAIISAVVVIIMYFLGPDCIGENIIWGECKENHPKKILILNTIVFAILMFIIVQLRVSATAKFLIAMGTVIVHYIVDYYQGDGIEIRDVTQLAFSCLGMELHSWHDSFCEKKVKPNIKKESAPNKPEQKVKKQPNKPDGETGRQEVVRPTPKVDPETKAEPKGEQMDQLKQMLSFKGSGGKTVSNKDTDEIALD